MRQWKSDYQIQTAWLGLMKGSSHIQQSISYQRISAIKQY